jgi:hypothetical protein
VFRRGLQHEEVNPGILVAGETDIANFSRLLRGQKRLDRPSDCENAIWIVESQDFVVLQKINAICLEPLYGCLNLPGCFVFPTAINLSH